MFIQTKICKFKNYYSFIRLFKIFKNEFYVKKNFHVMQLFFFSQCKVSVNGKKKILSTREDPKSW